MRSRSDPMSYGSHRDWDSPILLDSCLSLIGFARNAGKEEAGKIPPRMPCDTFTLNLRFLGGCHFIAFGVLKSLGFGTGQPQ
jgi:hypothetical protein